MYKYSPEYIAFFFPSVPSRLEMLIHLFIGVRHPLNERPDFDSKQSDGEAPVVELLGMWSTLSLLLLLVSLLPGVVAPFRVPSMDQMKLFDHLIMLAMCEQMTDDELNF